jgi:hypothetical protein
VYTRFLLGPQDILRPRVHRIPVTRYAVSSFRPA